MNLTNLRRHFFDYARGALRGHPGVRIGRDVKLTVLATTTCTAARRSRAACACGSAPAPVSS